MYFILVTCEDLETPSNGSVNCSSNNQPLQYQDNCTFQCNDGYEVQGSVMRQCEDSGEWSGSRTQCSPGVFIFQLFSGSYYSTTTTVPCVSLSDPENGNVTCPSNTSVFQDTCTYYCNHGYQLEGNRQTRCSADGTWSSEPVTCTILKCNDPEVEIANSQSVGVCNVTYGSSCSLNCSSGFSVSGNGEHVCDDVNDEGTSVMWRNIGSGFNCVPVGKS